MPKRLKELQNSYKESVANKVEEIIAPLKQENEQLKYQRDEAQRMVALRLNDYNELSNKYNTTVKQLKAELQLAQKDMNQILSNLSEFLRLLGDTTRRALVAICDFASDILANHFTFAQASAVNAYMVKGHDRKLDAEDLSILSRPFISENEYAKSKKELQNVANNLGWYKQAECYRLAEERQKAKESQQELKAEKDEPKWRMHR